MVAEQRQKQAEAALQAERDRLQTVLTQAPAIIAVLRGPRHVFELANPMYRQLIGTDRAIIGKPLAAALPEIPAQGFVDILNSAYRTGRPFTGSEAAVQLDRKGDGNLEEMFLNFAYLPLRNAHGEMDSILAHAVEVTEQVKARQRVEEQNRVLAMITGGAPLADALEFLVHSIEKQSSAGVKASVLFLDHDGKRLRHGVAPSLPKPYNDAVDGLEIGPSAGSGGTAAYTRDPVVVSNIATDPLWKDFKDIVLEYGLRSCWSTPIFSADRQVFGTFALYYDEPRMPGLEDRQIIDFATRTAALVIERKFTEERLKESEACFRTLAENVPTLCWMADADGWIY